MKIKTNRNASLEYLTGCKNTETLDLAHVKNAVTDCHEIIHLILKDIPVDIFSILGMRNLSAFVGELFARSLERVANGTFKSNPHQDGYPDLLLMDEAGLALWNKLSESGQLQEKAPFSPFANGGIEIKATCGSVPTPAECAKKGLAKPSMGDTRIDLLRSYDWKSHHRETNNLIGLVWDFDTRRSPQIVGVFFGNNLAEDDWGQIVQPRAGGGKTTSVSIISRAGVKKMYDNWLLVKDDNRYIGFFNAYNKDILI